MAKEYAKAFYNSKAWRKCRDNYMRSVGCLCERCLAKGQYTPAKIVHHLTYITPDNIDDPNITLNFNNLEALCWECHDNEHEHGRSKFGEKKRFKVDAFGNVTIRDD